MELSLRSGQRARIRTSRGRSSTGCQSCKSRRVKCDEIRPHCNECTKLGLQCLWRVQQVLSKPSKLSETSENDNTSIPASIANKTWNRDEAEIYHRFVNFFAPFAGRFRGGPFWQEVVPAVAQDCPHIRRAALSATVIFDSKGLDTEESKKAYETSLRLYSSSVQGAYQASIAGTTTAVGDLIVIIMGIVIYSYIERLLSPSANIERLYKIAFSFIQAHHKTLMNSRSSILLHCLIVLGPLPLSSGIDSLCVPRSHRITAFSLALKLISDLGYPEIHRLQFEVLSISYDVEDLAENSELSIPDLQSRMDNLYLGLMKFAAEMPFSSRNSFIQLLFYFRKSQVQWNFMRKIEIDKRVWKRTLYDFFDSLTNVSARFVTADKHEVREFLLSHHIYPCTVLIAWYSRDGLLMGKLKSMINKIVPESDLRAQSLLDYCQQLVSCSEETSMERLLFGSRPRVLRFTHCMVLASSLTKLQ